MGSVTPKLPAVFDRPERSGNNRAYFITGIVWPIGESWTAFHYAWSVN
jgi:hypothetical protein